MPSTPKYKKYCEAIRYFNELRDVPLIIYVPTTLKGFSVKMKINIPNNSKKRKKNILNESWDPDEPANLLKKNPTLITILLMV